MHKHLSTAAQNLQVGVFTRKQQRTLPRHTYESQGGSSKCAGKCGKRLANKSEMNFTRSAPFLGSAFPQIWREIRQRKATRSRISYDVDLAKLPTRTSCAAEGAVPKAGSSALVRDFIIPSLCQGSRSSFRKLRVLPVFEDVSYQLRQKAVLSNSFGFERAARCSAPCHAELQ